MVFFLNISWKSNIDDSFFVDYANERKIPLKEAPDWVMNNLYLLQLPSINVKNYVNDEYRYKITNYKGHKPIDILRQQPSFQHLYIHGFDKIKDYYGVRYSQLQGIKFHY